MAIPEVVLKILVWIAIVGVIILVLLLFFFCLGFANEPGECCNIICNVMCRGADCKEWWEEWWAECTENGCNLYAGCWFLCNGELRRRRHSRWLNEDDDLEQGGEGGSTSYELHPNLEYPLVELYGPAVQKTSSDEPLSSRMLIKTILPEIQDYSASILDLSTYVKLGRRVGGGGYGDVYQGEWSLTVNEGPYELSGALPPVAVKVMRVQILQDETAMARRTKRFEQELIIWQSLHHRNIVELIGITFHESSGQPCLVAQWMPNGTVKEYVKENPHVPKLPLLYDIASGLDYLHSQSPSVTHGDLKADNVLVDQDGNPCLCDFGLSRIVEEKPLWETTANQAGGTTRWKAPELLSGKQQTVSMQGDIYAYAMTCLEVMAGDVPYPELANDAAVVNAVLTEERIPTMPEHANIPMGLWYLWVQCWKLPAQERPAIAYILFVMRLIVDRRIFTVPGDFSIRHVAWSRNSPLLATSFFEKVPLEHGSNKSHVIRVWNLASGKQLGPPIKVKRVDSLALSSDASLVASGIQNGEYHALSVWRVASGKCIHFFEFGYPAESLAFSPAGSSIMYSINGKIKRFDFGSDESGMTVISDTFSSLNRSVARQTYDLHTGEHMRDIVYSCDGSLVATGTNTHGLEIWDSTSVKRIGGAIKVPGIITCLAFSLDGKNVVCCSREIVRSRDRLRALPESPLLPDSEQGVRSRTISYCSVYNITSKTTIGRRVVSSDIVYVSAALSPDSSILLLGTDDNHVVSIDVRSGLVAVPSPLPLDAAHRLPIAWSMSGYRLPMTSYPSLLQAYWDIVRAGKVAVTWDPQFECDQ